MRPFVGDAFADGRVPRASSPAPTPASATPRAAPLVQIGPNDWLLELFHGPTLAFKDVAMQLIGQLFEASLERSGRRLTIVGATSGDTGSAAIEAFRGREGVEVFILFPDGRVSEVQRRQMTTPDRGERARARHRRRLRRRAGAASRTCSTTTPSATASGSPGSTRSTGRGCWRRPSTTSPPPWRSARRTARSASRCRPATSATSSPATSPSAWACRSTGW